MYRLTRDKIIKKDRTKLLALYPDITPIGFNSFYCHGRLFDDIDDEINLRRALAHCIVTKIIKKEKGKK